MSKFIVVLTDEFDQIYLFKTEAPNRIALKNSDLSPSSLLFSKMIKDTTLFSRFGAKDIENCKVVIIEEINKMTEI